MVLEKWQGYDLSLFPVGQRALSPNNLRIDEKDMYSHKTGAYPDKTPPDTIGLVLFCNRDKQERQEEDEGTFWGEDFCFRLLALHLKRSVCH